VREQPAASAPDLAVLLEQALADFARAEADQHRVRGTLLGRRRGCAYVHGEVDTRGRPRIRVGDEQRRVERPRLDEAEPAARAGVLRPRTAEEQWPDREALLELLVDRDAGVAARQKRLGRRDRRR